MVHQQLLIFPQLTALENVLVGVPTGSIFLSPRRSRARATVAELNRSFGFDLPLDSPARDLSFAQRQQIELVRALYRSARILILDEPTSLLSPPEVQRLLDLLRSLKERGHTLLFVSHRLSEVFAVADRITVLRRGTGVGAFDTGLTSPEAVARLMVPPRDAPIQEPSPAVSKGSGANATGKPPVPLGMGLQSPLEGGRGVLSLHRGHTPLPPSRGESTDDERVKNFLTDDAGDGIVLELKGVCAPQYRGEAAIENIDLCLRGGEVLGIGGVVGNGQRTLAHVIAGHAFTSSGALLFEGRDWARVPAGERLEQGLRWLPANLLGEGFCAGLTLWQNCLLGRQKDGRFQRHGRLLKNAVRHWTQTELREGEVKFSDVDLPVETLSGGNAQRMGLIRVFNGSPRLVLLEQPGRGLDLRGREWLQKRVSDLGGRGVAFLVISYDLDELLELCDRIGILFRGRLMGMAQRDETTVEALVRWMTGIES
jgi:simple sugar transport system ATP-binding protein